MPIGLKEVSGGRLLVCHGPPPGDDPVAVRVPGIPDERRLAEAAESRLRTRSEDDDPGPSQAGISALRRSSVYTSEPSGRSSGASRPTNTTGPAGRSPVHIVTSARGRHRSTR